MRMVSMVLRRGFEGWIRPELEYQLGNDIGIWTCTVR